MSDDDERMLSITFTETIEYTADMEVDEARRVLGLREPALRRAVEEGALDDLSEAAMKRLKRAAEVVSEDVTIDDVSGSGDGW